ncbi:unnamed protein product [Cladocopium goreaui]|uniref:Uncharacterized protein n=1 Tax=Cladocopium goreaui TaxID=2562237 RepID=A0A9P1CB38_9DINO|nr:unnamed protein product [Cladocopium goreaui]|mmetsp:Transcript_76203/g.168326  ORF Transcript_76203/g.168326 Transcript_76203/m.168326 type:complete len:176 (+) Transcript_76203:72-599(+)
MSQVMSQGFRWSEVVEMEAATRHMEVFQGMHEVWDIPTWAFPMAEIERLEARRRRISKGTTGSSDSNRWSWTETSWEAMDVFSTASTRHPSKGSGFQPLCGVKQASGPLGKWTSALTKLGPLTEKAEGCGSVATDTPWREQIDDMLQRSESLLVRLHESTKMLPQPRRGPGLIGF